MIFNRKPDQPGREKYSQELANLFPFLKRLLPVNFKGYVQFDVLWFHKPKLLNGYYEFKPNKVLYRVKADTDLGKEIAKSHVGIGLHSYFKSVEEDEPRAISDLNKLKLRPSPGLVVIGTKLPVKKTVPAAVPECQKLLKFIDTNKQSIDNFFNKTALGLLKIMDLPDQMKSFLANYASQGLKLTESIPNDFLRYIENNTKISITKKANIVSYIKDNVDDYRKVWRIVIAIVIIKNGIKLELDKATGAHIEATIDGNAGHEGFVSDTPHGKIKLVDRPVFMMKTQNQVLESAISVNRILMELNIPKLVQDFGPKLMQKLYKDIKVHSTEEETRHEEEYVVKQVVAYDPSPDKKYSVWLVGNYARNNIKRLEDIPSRVVPALQKFDKLVRTKKIPPEQRDINRYKSVEDLESMVEKFDIETASNKEVDDKITKELLSNGSAKLIYNSSILKVISPKTEEASKWFGKGTRWCTAANDHNAFDDYSERGTLYIVSIKGKNEKYQFFFDTAGGYDNQFCDVQDKEIDPREIANQYPELFKIFENISKETGTLAFTRNITDDDIIEAVVFNNNYEELKYIDTILSDRVIDNIIDNNKTRAFKTLKYMTFDQISKTVKKDNLFLTYDPMPMKWLNFTDNKVNILSEEQKIKLMKIEAFNSPSQIIFWMRKLATVSDFREIPEEVQMIAARKNPGVFRQYHQNFPGHPPCKKVQEYLFVALGYDLYNLTKEEKEEAEKMYSNEIVKKNKKSDVSALLKKGFKS
jgi:hypothetical protein